MEILLEFAAFKKYFQTVADTIKMEGDEDARILLDSINLDKGYSKKLIDTIVEMGDVHEEICTILNDFNGTTYDRFKILTIEQIILYTKFYVIEWSTLMDMISKFINYGFNLGIAESDLNFGLIYRNEHIRQSELGEIIKEYQQKLNITEYNKKRNDIIHRGIVIEDEIKKLRDKWDLLNGKKYGLIPNNRISEKEYNRECKNLYKENFEIGMIKQKQYFEHYKKTVEFIELIAIVIAKKTVELFKKGIL